MITQTHSFFLLRVSLLYSSNFHPSSTLLNFSIPDPNHEREGQFGQTTAGLVHLKEEIRMVANNNSQ